MPQKPPKKRPYRPQVYADGGPSTSKRGAHKRSKEFRLDLDTDHAYLVEKRLLHWSNQEILDGLNARRMEIARAKARERGLSPEEVERAASDAKISGFTLSNDMRKVFAGLAEFKVFGAQMLAQNRILELQMEIHRLNIVEREAWDAYYAAKSGETFDEEVTIAPGRKKTTKISARRPEEAWLSLVVKCGVARVEIGERIFKLAGQIGLWSTMEEEIRELQGVKADDLEALYLYSLRHVWKAEAQISGNQGEAIERARLFQAAISEARRQAGRPPNTPSETGGPVVHELLVTVLAPGSAAASS